MLQRSLLLACSLYSAALVAQPGILDPTFGVGGKAVAPMAGTYCSGEAIAEQADGKIIVVGATPGNAMLARFTVAGSLDPTFGTGGIVLTDVDASNDFVGCVAVQPDGRILAGGVRFDATASGKAIVMRYTSNGTLDNSFGTAGIRTLAMTAASHFVKGIALQSDGKIAVCGERWTGSVWQAYATRLNANGTDDAAFGNVQLDLAAGGEANATDMALQGDGKIVVCGNGGNSANAGMFAVRLNSDGSFDTGFGIGGKVLLDQGGLDQDKAWSVRVQADGKILLGGLTYDDGGYDPAVVRLLPNGMLDSGFGTNGVVEIPLAVDDWAAPSLALQPDGKILLGVDDNLANTPRTKVVRLLPDGTFDAAFGIAGIGTSNATSGSNNSEYAVRTHFLADGGIAVAGYADGPSNTEMALWKFQSGVHVGVQERGMTRALAITPNPVQDRFIVSGPTPLDPHAVVSVHDLCGREVPVVTMRAGHGITVAAGTLRAGTYTVSLATDKGRSTAHFIKE